MDLYGTGETGSLNFRKKTLETELIQLSVYRCRKHTEKPRIVQTVHQQRWNKRGQVTWNKNSTTNIQIGLSSISEYKICTWEFITDNFRKTGLIQRICFGSFQWSMCTHGLVSIERCNKAEKRGNWGECKTLVKLGNSWLI